MSNRLVTRRQCLQTAAATVLAQGAARPLWSNGTAGSSETKSVAAVVTAYRKGLHADVLLGKILEGWNQDGGKGPALKLASMYVEQIEGQDLARPMAAKHKVPMFDSIEKAITLGGKSIPVDGVICIGEHGRYPYNKKGQHLYPRRRFFKGICDTFEKYGKVVPVFNDKHLGPQWEDAKWMYDRARELKVPFMAGSSLPVTFRKPDLEIPLGSDIESAVGVGYSGLDIYGSHTLDCYQCLVERRRHAEAGVKSVQCLQGEAMWNAMDNGAVPKDVLQAVLDVLPKQAKPVFRNGPGATLFLFDYVDGFRGRVLMLPGFVAGIGAAVKIRGRKPQGTRFEERAKPYYPHFAYLLKAVEKMMHTGRPSYPVERVLLTSGILDRALTSRVSGFKRLATPELKITYQPVAYPHAPRPALTAAPA